MSVLNWTIQGGEDPSEAVRMWITGASITYPGTYMFSRVIDGTRREPVQGPIASDRYEDNTPVLVFFDYLYPLDTTWHYDLFDSTGTVLLDTSPTVGPYSSNGTPWVRDAVYPSTRISPMTIVDLAERSHAGRVNVYTQIAETYPLTIGDVRSGPTGTIAALCRSHAERDTLIRAMSSGSPCQLRIPASCQALFDEMYFTPVDITETRFGRTGACVLTIDFVTVQLTDLPPYVAIAYSVQTANAAASGMDYQDLTYAFNYHDYADMTASPTGIAP